MIPKLSDTVKRQGLLIRTNTWRLVMLAGCVGLLAGGINRIHAQSYSNPSTILVPGPGIASPYPSVITVPGGGGRKLTGEIVSVSVTLHHVVHTIPDDLDVLLVGPEGQQVMLMSDAGGNNPLNGVDLTFDVNASKVMPDSGQIISASYLPTDYEPTEILPTPAPGGPYGTDLGVFVGADPNGTWELYVYGDTSASGSGEILNGWTLVFEVAEPPTIIMQPETQTVAPGESATFDVTVSGTPPFGYQWSYNDQLLVPFGAGSPSLTLTNVQATHAGTYTVVVTNAARPTGVTSSNAQLNVTGPLTLAGSPTSQTLAPGADVVLRVTAAGDPPLYYQWRCNGFLLYESTNSSLALNNVQVTNGGSYSVTVWNEESALTSPQANLVVTNGGPIPAADDFADREPVVINPLLKGILQGDSSAATSEDGEPLLSGGGKSVWYEWTAPTDGTVTLTLHGSGFDTLLGVFTGSELTNLTPVTSDDNRAGCYTSLLRYNATGGQAYSWMIDGYGAQGAGGNYTLSWELFPTAELVPVIVEPPLPQVAVQGTDAAFSVLIESPAFETYQWYRNDALIPGADQSTFSISNATVSDVGSYYVLVTLPNGLQTTSGAAPFQVGSGFGLAASGRPPIPNLPPSISVGLGNPGWTTFYSDEANGVTNNINPCDSPFFRTMFVQVAAEDGGVVQLDTVDSDVSLLLAVYQGVPGLPGSQLLACDVVSGPSGLPSRVQYALPDSTTNTAVVAVLGDNNGNITVNAQMGFAPPLTNQPLLVAVAPGSSHQLELPNHGWVPAPSVQWRFDGQDLLSATNATLLLTDFDVTQAGTYSVVLSNFVGTTTNVVAYVYQAGSPVLRAQLLSQQANPDALIMGSGEQAFALESATAVDGPWSAVATNPDPNFPLIYTNPDVLMDTQRFFRAVPWAPDP